MNSKIENQALIGKCSYEEIVKNERSKPIFSNYIDRFNFGFWIWYSKDNRLFLSESFSNMVGIPKGSVPSVELLLEYVYANDQEKFLNFWKTLLDGFVPDDFTFQVYMPDGSLRSIRCSVEITSKTGYGVSVFRT
jgi:PAS domain-containing protein